MPEDKINYEKLKFKAGLEIHQQLDTNKLFCNCPSFLRQDKPDFEFRRKLHVVAGESGEVDAAAKYQASLDKEFIYEGYKENSCLVEMDEEPPHEINKEALTIAVQIALLLNCEILPITQIMRKTVIDGSNTSGFQRTVLIAHSGFVETGYGKVKIASVCLEEDAARPSGENDSNSKRYKLDRLGIPLIEIATDPDIKNAEQAKEVALHIGDILRSSKVKRGLGTIRQDVNVSIDRHPRIEIKGFQDVKMFVPVIENEVKRQEENLKNGKNIQKEVRNALPNGKTEFLRPMPGADRMYPETDLPLLKISRDFINEAKKTLPKLNSEVEEELAKKGLNQDMIKILFKEKKLDYFKELLLILDNVNLVAKVILIYVKDIASKNKKTQEEVEDILKEAIPTILEAVRDKKLEEGKIKDVLEKIVQGQSVKDALFVEKKDLNLVEEEVVKIIKSKPGLNANAYMGLVMAAMKGKVDGKTAMELIQKHLK